MRNNNNLLYFITGALVIVVAVMGYYIYDKQKQPDGVQLNIGKDGVSIEKK
jgi:hypothetical protein